MFLFSYLLAYNRYLSLIGIFVILGLCFLLSKDRKAINYRLVGIGLAMQWLIAIFMLKFSLGQKVISVIADLFTKLYLFAEEGSRFIFGNLLDSLGPWGFVFGFKVLPIIIFFGALMALLFYLGIVQWCVAGVNFLLRPLLGTSGAETLVAIANSFLGQTEAPLLIRDYLSSMTKSELLVVMVSGMGTMSGAIITVYGAMGVPIAHLLAASVMAIPTTLIISKMLLPETEKTATATGAKVKFKSKATNILDAISQGTFDGLNIAVSIGAILISFLAMIALFDSGLGLCSQVINTILSYIGIGISMPILSIGGLFSWICSPFAYLLGFTGAEALSVGKLLGTKLAINELIGYKNLIAEHLAPRTTAIVTYALCGFANFSSIGMQIGGIGALVPEKRHLLAELGMYALIGGTLSNLLCAMVASLLL